MRKVTILHLLLLVLVCSTALADEQPAERPKIGLVLGGGGARGVAHVGVLKVLHELNIPIDYVAGTSMGAIVGALFSIGMTPHQIENQILSVDWDDLFSDSPHRESRTFRRKQDDSAFFFPVEFGLKDHKVVLAPGVVAGQKLGFVFRNPQLYLGGHESFDNLAYPFRPVATDLRTGEVFVPERGNLLRAVRASMSIPGVFPPVEWDGHYLVDGYLARNVPVDVVRQMGADIVIAVDVGAIPENTPSRNLQTLDGIAEQTATITARQNVVVQLPDADIVIHVDTGNISTRDFKRVAETLPMGRDAALAREQDLLSFALDPDAYRNHIKAHQMPAPGAVVIDSITIRNNSRVSDHVIRRNIHQQTGQFLDMDNLKKDLGWIYDFGVFELVDFAITRADSFTTLEIMAIEKYYAPYNLNFGLDYSGGEGGRSTLDMRARLTRMELNDYGAEWRTDLQLGRNNGLRSEIYQPLLWTRRPFATLGFTLANDRLDWFAQNTRMGEYTIFQFTGHADLGYRLGTVGEIRTGIRYGHLEASDRGSIGLDEYKGPNGMFTLRLGLDRLNSAVLPTRGFDGMAHLNLARDHLGAEYDYDRLELKARGVQSWHGHTLSAAFQGGSSLDTDLPDYSKFRIGGLYQLGGYVNGQIHGQVYGIGTLGWNKLLAGSPSPFSLSWHIALILEAGNAWDSTNDMALEDLRYSGTLALIAKTLLGPLVFAYGHADDGNDAVYVTLGRMFSFAR